MTKGVVWMTYCIVIQMRWVTRVTLGGIKCHLSHSCQMNDRGCRWCKAQWPHPSRYTLEGTLHRVSVDFGKKRSTYVIKHRTCSIHAVQSDIVTNICNVSVTPSDCVWAVNWKFIARSHSMNTEPATQYGAYSSAYHDCMLFNNPNFHRAVKHRQRC